MRRRLRKNPPPPPKTLLDLDRLPTKDELKAFFRENDWTAAKPYDLSKMKSENAETAVYVKDVFDRLWDQSAERHGQKSPPKCFTKDYPPEVMKNAIGDIVAGKVTEILNDEKQLETILTPFFEKGNEEERANPFANNAMDTLLDTVGYDNAVMESFFSNLKREELYRTRYHSEREFKSAIDCYMMFYNEKRPHHHNAYQTPVKRESSFFQRVDTILD